MSSDMSIRRRAFAALALCVLAGAAQAANVELGKQKATQFLQGLEGLQAQFKQTLADGSGQITDTSNGTLAIKRPNRFRWDYRDPHEQLIISDGTRVWVYDSDLEQVTVRKLDVALSSTPAMLLSGAGALEDNFNVVDASQRDGLLWVTMQPKRNDTDFKSVRLGFTATGNELRAMELADKLGQTTLLEFSQFERNPPLDPSRFVFKVPPGADVIGDSGADAAPKAANQDR